MSAAMIARARERVEALAERRRAGIANAARDAGIDAEVDGEAVRLSGRGLMERWMTDARLRDLGREEA